MCVCLCVYVCVIACECVHVRVRLLGKDSILFFVKRDNLGLAFWLLCSMHAVIQVPPDGVVGSRNCRCHSFAACTIDMTVRFNRQPDCECCHLWLLALYCTADNLLIASCLFWLADWPSAYVPATAIPKRLLHLSGCLLSLKYSKDFCRLSTFPAYTFLHPVSA